MMMHIHGINYYRTRRKGKNSNTNNTETAKSLSVCQSQCQSEVDVRRYALVVISTLLHEESRGEESNNQRLPQLAQIPLHTIHEVIDNMKTFQIVNLLALVASAMAFAPNTVPQG